MSFDDLHSSLSSNGRLTTEATDIELDVRLLGSLVEENEEIPADDSELLARLSNADIVASGVEARLDGILDTLDDLLASFESEDSNRPQEVAIPRSEPQSGPRAKRRSSPSVSLSRDRPDEADESFERIIQLLPKSLVSGVSESSSFKTIVNHLSSCDCFGPGRNQMNTTDMSKGYHFFETVTTEEYMAVKYLMEEPSFQYRPRLTYSFSDRTLIVDATVHPGNTHN